MFSNMLFMPMGIAVYAVSNIFKIYNIHDKIAAMFLIDMIINEFTKKHEKMIIDYGRQDMVDIKTIK